MTRSQPGLRQRFVIALGRFRTDGKLFFVPVVAPSLNYDNRPRLDIMILLVVVL